MSQENNKMATTPMKSLFWSMGLPMIISMVLQALYNVVDSIFVANMGADGVIANRALTIAFPVQIMIIAIGVGTGVGLNALLSKSLGERKMEMVNKTAGNGIFLSLVIYAVFLLFGIFGSRWFITLFAEGDSAVIEMGTAYLQICTILSLGSIGFTVYERFLQATGRTMYSTIAQVSGAVTNIVLDYIFIYPLGMGVRGAAWATVIGQFASLFIAMFLHYTRNPEIDGNPKYIKPDLGIIKGIYEIGISAALMQALLSVMMSGMTAILNTADADLTVLISSFGIYYKIQQIALFAAFGLSNTIISILSFNYGMGNKKRSQAAVRYGITDTLIVTLIIAIAFEILARPLASLFGLSGEATTEVIDVCARALRIASLGFVFMGFSVAVQGVLQALRYAIRPLIISLLRLVIFVFPIAYYFAGRSDVMQSVWWTFPIAEVLTAVISVFILKSSYEAKITTLGEEAPAKKAASPAGSAPAASAVSAAFDNIADAADSAAAAAAGTKQPIIVISREHGTNGKHIARTLAKELGLSFYDKEEVKNYAIENKMVEDKDDEELYKTFLSLDVEKESIFAQQSVIKDIAKRGGCVIVGRGADYLLENEENVTRVFLYAPMDYRIGNIVKNYGDNEAEARRHIVSSDQTRATYYSLIADKVWGDKDNYDLCINCEMGDAKVIELLKAYML